MKKKFILILLTLVTAYFIELYAKQMNQDDDFVPDEITAVKIAEAIWLPIYGEKIYDYKPFVAKLVNKKIWIVEGTLHSSKGGVPHIEIQKADCKILKVFHEK